MIQNLGYKRFMTIVLVATLFLSTLQDGQIGLINPSLTFANEVDDINDSQLEQTMDENIEFEPDEDIFSDEELENLENQENMEGLNDMEDESIDKENKDDKDILIEEDNPEENINEIEDTIMVSDETDLERALLSDSESVFISLVRDINIDKPLYIYEGLESLLISGLNPKTGKIHKLNFIDEGVIVNSSNKLSIFEIEDMEIISSGIEGIIVSKENSFEKAIFRNINFKGNSLIIDENATIIFQGETVLENLESGTIINGKNIDIYDNFVFTNFNSGDTPSFIINNRLLNIKTDSNVLMDIKENKEIFRGN